MKSPRCTSLFGGMPGVQLYLFGRRMRGERNIYIRETPGMWGGGEVVEERQEKISMRI